MPDHSINSPDTQRLLTRILAGDRQAFSELFQRHRQKLRRAVQLRFDHRLRTRVDESDIVQETQIEAFRRLNDYLQRQPMPFGLWLRKTAQERIYYHRRAHLATACRSLYREQSLPDQSSMMIVAPFLERELSPSKRMVSCESRRLVREAVNELAELDREVLLMRNVEGLSQQEIAHVLGLNHEAVRKRYGRAIVKLQRLLASKGLTEDDS